MVGALLRQLDMLNIEPSAPNWLAYVGSSLHDTVRFGKEAVVPDIYDRAKRSEVMRRVRGQDTGPEMAVRRALHRRGYRYRLHRVDLPGRPDIALPRRKSVIFVHGCFWHGHPGCNHAARPTSNESFWNRKLDRNMERDRQNIEKLNRAGWRTLVIWECEVKSDTKIAQIIRDFLGE